MLEIEPSPAVPGDWRDPAIFNRLEESIAKNPRPAGRKRGRLKYGAGKPVPPRLMKALEKEVSAFAESIKRRFPALMKKRAIPTKRLIQSWIGKKLPPLPRRSGRPEKWEISKATRLKALQHAEIRSGVRGLTDWDEIAAACITGWSEMREAIRVRERKRLRNSVGARKGRATKRP